ncbi:MAG: LegC family aminotransferase [Verrucomicrobiota bacterium]
MSEKLPFIPLCVPEVAGTEIRYLQECLDTNWLSYAGPHVNLFEEKLAKEVGFQHAVAVSSGTAALHLALVMAGVQLDDEVVMPGISFVAPANACRYCGAWPVFVDIQKKTWQWDLDQVEDFLKNHCERKGGQLVNWQTGRRIAALMPVHLFGSLCDIQRLARIAETYQLPMVEDAAECLGARYGDVRLGEAIDSSNVLRITCTSFNGNKVITTGGGGALFTNEESVAQRARHLSTTAKAGGVEFYHDEVGYNYRLTNISAAVGLGQLERLVSYVERKREINQAYRNAFADYADVVSLPAADNIYSTYWMYTLMMPENSRDLITYLGEQEVMARPVWVPMYQLPMLGEAYCHSKQFSEELYDRGVSLPCSVGLTVEQQNRVIKLVIAYLDKKYRNN